MSDSPETSALESPRRSIVHYAVIGIVITVLVAVVVLVVLSAFSPQMGPLYPNIINEL